MSLLRRFCRHRLQRTLPAQGMRLIMAFLDLPSKWREEQCTLAEFCSYIARDVLAHIDLAAEARVQKPKRALVDAASECEDSSSDEAHPRTPATVELVDLGGGDNDDHDTQDHEVLPNEISNFPLHDMTRTIS